MMENSKKELEIYVHIPFCVKKCLYCDFLSFDNRTTIHERYVNRLLNEIETANVEYEQGKANDYVVNSVFIGGGTPSILDAKWIEQILCKLKTRFTIQENAEISMEVNPGTVDAGKLQRYKNAGVNRLSIGLQSAIDSELRELGRIHNYEGFLETFQRARQAGFRNINIDLMTAIPTQTMESLQTTLTRVLKLQPEHISAYSLIVEENTPFAKMELQLPSEDDERNMYYLTGQMLADHGYHRYEISNYALPGYECRHNSGYWIGTDYLSFGLGASSKVENIRWKNTDDMDLYLETSDIRTDKNELSKKDRMEEFMFLGMRMTEGVSEQAFVEKFHATMDDFYANVLKSLSKDGLIERKEGKIKLTSFGIDVSNCVFEKFLLDNTCKIDL